MSIAQYKTHTQKNKLSGFDHFIQDVFVSLTKELNSITDRFYRYDTSPDGMKGYDNVFKIIERTWVGIFQSALLKTNPQITCMQEFNVLNGERVFGRCDFLFDWNNGIPNHIITEAKCYEFLNDWDRSLNQTYFNRLLNQAYGYYEAEKDFYKEKTWLLALSFEWVRDSDRLTQAQAIIDNWLFEKQVPHFISLIKGHQRGVFVYGQIAEADNFIKP